MKKGAHKSICPHGHPRVRRPDRWSCPTCDTARSRRVRGGLAPHCQCGRRIARRINGQRPAECWHCRTKRNGDFTYRQRVRLAMKSYCIGYEGYACGKVVYTGERCGPCAIAHTSTLKLQASSEQREESYRRCELNGCMQMIRFGVNGMGYTTMECPTHGSRLMPRGQREIEAA